jgi:hypothetical protein
MQPGAVLVFPVFERENLSAKASKLGEFLLDFLQPILPLGVGKLRMCVLCAFTTILLVQFFKACDFRAETSNLFAEDFEVIHAIKDTASRTIERQ